jgi:hypothetical protein
MRRLLSTVMMVASLGVAQAQPRAGQAAGGVGWTAPASWEVQSDRPMRVATYHIPPARGDTEHAELAVFYFGAGQGGAVETNLKRWVAQFHKPDGSPIPEAEARPRQETLAGLPVTTLDVRGTYIGGGPMMGPSSPKPGSRLLGAIVEGPEGPLFFKLTGPERTVTGAEKGFRKLLQSVKKQ